MKKAKAISIDELDLTPRERAQHFFNKGYGYAMLHLHHGLEEEELTGLEDVLMKHLDHLKGQKDFLKDKMKKALAKKTPR